MLYRPHFCCHCGEKIVRSKWTPLTSRRFCDFCEIEQKQHELLPKVVMAITLLIGAAGLTAYLSADAKQTVSRSNLAAQTRDGDRPRTDKQTSRANNLPTNTAARMAANSDGPNSNIAAPINVQRGQTRNASTESVFYCGAMTRKGTACTRRVKTAGRCWQHAGQAAINVPRN